MRARRPGQPALVLVHSCIVHQNMVARVAQAMALKPRRLEVAPSNMNFRFPEFPTLIADPGAAEVEAAG